MTEFNVGDRVRLTKGDTVIEGTVEFRPTMGIDDAWDAKDLMLADRRLPMWASVGYTAELIEAAPKPLPTEGWWYDKQGDVVWHFEKSTDGTQCATRYGDGYQAMVREWVSEEELDDGTEDWVRIDDENA